MGHKRASASAVAQHIRRELLSVDTAEDLPNALTDALARYGVHTAFVGRSQQRRKRSAGAEHIGTQRPSRLGERVCAQGLDQVGRTVSWRALLRTTLPLEGG